MSYLYFEKGEISLYEENILYSQYTFDSWN